MQFSLTSKWSLRQRCFGQGRFQWRCWELPSKAVVQPQIHYYQCWDKPCAAEAEELSPARLPAPKEGKHSSGAGCGTYLPALVLFVPKQSSCYPE